MRGGMSGLPNLLETCAYLGYGSNLFGRQFGDMLVFVFFDQDPENLHE